MARRWSHAREHGEDAEHANESSAVAERRTPLLPLCEKNADPDDAGAGMIQEAQGGPR